MNPNRTSELDFVVAPVAYLSDFEGPAQYRVYPPASGRKPETPPKRYHDMRIFDCRPLASEVSLDREGFALRSQASTVGDFYDDDLVRRVYYPEVEALMRQATGALAVFPFDHNVRSARGAAEGQSGVSAPVDMAHNDYTEASGPRRVREILAERGRSDLDGHRAALINAWRPIRGPVQDIPLTVCESGSASPTDFVDTAIEHYGEVDLSVPRHTGEITSFRHNPAHRWFYASNMQPDEVLLLKCYDSSRDVQARFTAHTGFRNPNCPPGAVPRESIEVRTLVIFPG